MADAPPPPLRRIPRHDADDYYLRDAVDDPFRGPLPCRRKSDRHRRPPRDPSPGLAAPLGPRRRDRRALWSPSPPPPPPRRNSSMPAVIAKKGAAWWANPLVKAGAQAAMQSRHDPSLWFGAKGAALVDGFMAEKHPGTVRQDVMRHGIDAVMGDVSKRTAGEKHGFHRSGGGSGRSRSRSRRHD